MTKNDIIEILDRNTKAVERAMVFLYERQTVAEQHTGTTLVYNHRGFSGAHDKSGSYYARWVLSGRSLTGRHLDKARRIAKRYTRQLLEGVAEKRARTS